MKETYLTIKDFAALASLSTRRIYSKREQLIAWGKWEAKWDFINDVGSLRISSAALPAFKRDFRRKEEREHANS